MAWSKISRATSTCSFARISGGDQRMEFGPQPRMIRPRLKQSISIASRSSGVGVEARFVGDKLDAQHHSQAADVADAVVFVLQLVEACFEIRTDLAAVIDQAALRAARSFSRQPSDATGLPPKVEACAPLCQSMMSARAMQAPIGMPEPRPLARHMMSALTPG